jgi:excinuclease ABC subunit C
MADSLKTKEKTSRKTAPAIAGVQSGLVRGLKVIRDCLATLPGAPGVYRMINGRGDVLYVGKAGRLNRRVAAYTMPSKLPIRLQRMIAETESMEIVTTHTEVEALLLESNLIKKMRPRYNVLLRDDKTFPHILITSDQDYPQVIKHRGAQNRPGHYFGPFASAGAVNRTLSALQRAFLLRNCTDSVFNNRHRPCLQYHIKRCSAPCVNRITLQDYQRLVDEAREFLANGSRAIQDKLADQMQHESDNLKFEAAARIRDRIHALTQVQAHQDINLEGVEDADVIALHQDRGQSCVQVFFFRGGRNYGNRAYFPSHDRHHEPASVLAAFVGQFYDDKPPPRTILLSHDIPERDLIAAALSQRADRKIQLTTPKRGVKLKPVEHALANARDALGRRQAESASQRRLLDALAERLDMETPPTRIEIYDNSHIQGTNAVGAMVVSGPDGFVKAAYRKFNIKTVGKRSDDIPGDEDTATDSATDTLADPAKESPKGGDDYAMMREVLTRRFMRALKEDPERVAETWPGLILIDGGPGQTAIAHDVLSELGIDDIAVLGVAKGPDRDAGRERLHRPGRPAFTLPMRDPLLYFIQRLRDEAHRFAISTHRARRSKAIAASPLDEIAGVGAKRKKALLLHFGSARGVAGAGLSDLAAVEGISTTVAEKIYGHFHADH